MASVGCNFLCRGCDEKICDEKFSYKVKKEKAYVSGVLDCVNKKTGHGKNLILVCSCGKNIGEFITYKKERKYCLDLKKVTRCTVRNSEDSHTKSLRHQGKAVPLPTDVFAPTVSKNIRVASNEPAKNSTVYGEEAEKENEIKQLKETITALKERMKSMERENVNKFKDVCGMLLSQKLEIQRLQEIIWVLHPNINLEQAFSVDDKVLYFIPDSVTSADNLNVED